MDYVPERHDVTRRGVLHLVAGAAAALALQEATFPAARAQLATPVPNDVALRLDDLISSWHVEGGFSGVIAAALGEEMRFMQGYGLADRRAGRPNTPDTPFPIGSITKTFTALAIMQLAEAGRLSVEDPVTRHLPDFPAPARDGVALTLHHLLSHTGGVNPDFDYTVTGHVRERIYTAVGTGLYFAPGSRFSYSNTGYGVLGLVLEAVTDQSWAAYLHQAIFGPAGMQTSGVIGVDDPTPALALGYFGATEASPRSLEIGAFSAGAVFTTAEDLLRFDRALFGGQLLSAAGVTRMRTPVLDTQGYGLFIHDLDGRQVVEHGGELAGFRAGNIWFSDEDATIIILANQSLLSPDDLLQQLAAALLGPA